MSKNLDNPECCPVNGYLVFKRQRPLTRNDEPQLFYLAINTEVPKARKNNGLKLPPKGKFTWMDDEKHDSSLPTSFREEIGKPKSKKASFHKLVDNNIPSNEIVKYM